MICYKDRTFCDFWKECANAKDCPVCLTEEVKRKAEAFGLPICHYSEKPECFKEKE